MSGRPVGEDGIVEQLERRAARATLSAERRDEIVGSVSLRAAVGQVGTARSSLWARLAAALVVLVLAGATFVAGLGGGPAATTSAPSGAPQASDEPTPVVPSPAQFDEVSVLTSEQVVAMVGDPAWVGRTVLVKAAYVQTEARSFATCDAPAGVDCTPTLPLALGPCDWREEDSLAEERCVIGSLEGTDIVVVTRTLPDDYGAWDASTPRLYAFTVRSKVLELVGAVVSRPTGPLFPLDTGSQDELEAVPPGYTIAVQGWLVGVGHHVASCGPYIEGPPPPPDSPFGCGITDFLSPESFQPVTVYENGWSVAAPDPGLAVQLGAYDEFAAQPVIDDDGLAIPRPGTYVVRSVQDERPAASGRRGWQVVARLDTALPALDSLVLRAESAVPDTDLPLEDALSLVSTARKWLIPYPGPDGATGLGDRPLAASWVQRSGDQARVQFHDLGNGRTIMTLLKLEAGQPVALVDVSASEPNTVALLSTWEAGQASLIAVLETRYRPRPGLRTGTPTGVACPRTEGLCASVPLLRDEGMEPGSHLVDVIVDIGRESIVAEVPAAPEGAAP
ncbi:MAG: hypothetical protein H0V04_02780 [Chloroflexi bacterium]|nr:hypothetical protein [Chloroflexota bacterium]